MPQGRDTLEVFDFGLLLQALSQSLKVGALRVRSRLGEKYIYFSRGKLKAIFTRRSRIRIGRILYNLRVLEKKDLKQVIDDQDAGKVDLPLGEELLARGLVSQEDLDAAIRYQMMEELLEIFYWKEYSYEFISGAPERSIQSISDDLTRVGGSQDINDLLLNVSRIIDDMEKFNRVIPSVRDVYELTVNPEEYWAREGRSPQLYQLLTIIDGQRDLREILRDMRMNRFAVIELLCRLRVEKIIRPKNSFELLMLGENNLKVFSPEKLERIYQRVRELGVEGFDVSLKLASVNRELGKHQKAAELYVEHAEKALADGESTKAEEGARRAVELFPDSAVMRELLTRVLEKLEMRDELLVELKELAGIHCRNGERVMEESALRRALLLEPESEDLLLASAEAHLATGNGQQAARDLFTLAAIRKGEGDASGAEDALRGAVRAVPGSIRFRNALVGHLAEHGDHEAAAKELRILVSTVQDRCTLSGRSSRTALRAIRKRMEALGLQASAVSVLLAEAFAAGSDQDSAREVLFRAAEAHRTAGRLAEAREALDHAVGVVPDDVELRRHLARTLVELREEDEAVIHFRRVAEQLTQADELEDAEGTYLEMLEIRPISPETMDALSDVLVMQGRDGEAADRLAQVGQLFRAAGLSAEAVKRYDHACRLDATNTDHLLGLAESLAEALDMDRSVESYDRLMKLLRSRGDHAAAIEVGLRIIRADRSRPDVPQDLKDSYRALGEDLKERLEV